MSKQKQLEDWIRQAAAGPGLSSLRERLDASPALPEDVIARYHAGLMSPEEEALVAREIALNEQNLEMLARMRQDVEEAARETAPVESRWRRWLGSFSSALPDGAAWRPMRFAGAAAMLALAMFAGYVTINSRAPRVGAAHQSQLSVKLRGVSPAGSSVTLDCGTIVERVDPNWPLRRPVGFDPDLRWFAWDPVESATRYDLQLYGPSGEVLFEQAGLPLPHARLPRGVARELPKDAPLEWVVTAWFDEDQAPIRAVASFRLSD